MPGCDSNLGWVLCLQVTSSLGEGLYLSSACCDGAAQDDCLINSLAFKASRGIMGLSLLSQGFQ